jgi:beta-galactosidase
LLTTRAGGGVFLTADHYAQQTTIAQVKISLMSRTRKCRTIVASRPWYARTESGYISPPMSNHFRYGVCYYPEHWHPSRHRSDIARIAKAGFNTVRLGEGAWSYWEPRQGQYQFDLFDQVIDLCRQHGLFVILGTPTYTGPAWIAKNYPETLLWNFQRQPVHHGSRRIYNYTSEKYLDLSDRLCTALAKHYKNEKQVIGWQLDNEFNNGMDASYAPSDTIAFQRWCRRKYRTIDKLNETWGTVFWSQTYDSWDQVDLPGPTPHPQNPHVLLDEARFVSDTTVAFAKRQADILRLHNPRWQITHNGLFGNLNGRDLAKVLDYFSHDHYPLFDKESHWWSYGFSLQQARSLTFPFGVMEQQSGPGGQMTYLLRTPRPGQLRLFAWQPVAHGADTLLYFRWRTCPYGAEQHWHGLIDQDDRDNRRLSEAIATGREFASLPDDYLGAEPVRVVGIYRDFDTETNERKINTYVKEGAWEQARWMHEAVKRHLPVDHVWADTDWTGYKLIIAPHAKIVSKSLLKKMTEFVTAGGTLVLGAQSGLHDERLHIVEQPLPGLLRRIAGVEIDDWTTLVGTETREARLPSGDTLPFNAFVERLRPTTATPLAWWTGVDPLLGDAPAVTVNTVGRGRVYYVGGYATNPAISGLLSLIATDLDLQPAAIAGTEIEMVLRASAKRRYLSLLNHTPGSHRIHGLAGGKVLVGDGTITSAGDLSLPAYGVAVVELR